MSDACLPYDQQFDATSFNILNFQDWYRPQFQNNSTLQTDSFHY